MSIFCQSWYYLFSLSHQLLLVRPTVKHYLAAVLDSTWRPDYFHLEVAHQL